MIAFTGAQLAADVDSIVSTMGLRRDWPNLSVISLAHSYGFSNLVLPLLLHGIPLILCHSPLPESVRQAVGLGFWPEPDVRLTSGTFRSADLAAIQAGAVYLRGRSTDLINVAGRKVLPDTIERALVAHPKVRQCVVFGAPDQERERTDMVVACVSEVEEVTGDELRHHLLDTLPAWQVPRYWWFVPSIGFNERGKVSRNTWRQRFLQRRES